MTAAETDAGSREAVAAPKDLPVEPPSHSAAQEFANGASRPVPVRSDDAAVAGVSNSMRTLGAVVPPATAATALLFYFGWARSAAEARYLGLDEGAMGMSPSDYMLRSIDSLYLPLTAAAVLMLAWVAAHHRIVPSVTGASARRTAVLRGLRLGTLAWPVIPGLGWLVAVLFPATGPLVIPLSWTLGILLGAYAGHLLRLTRGTRRGGAADTLAPLLIGLLVLLTLFWEVSNFATIVGRGQGAAIAHDIRRLTRVVVYSPADLHLDAPGVKAQPLGSADHPTVRYTGLRFLQHSGGKYFLLSDGWTRQYGVVVILPDDGDLRLEFVRGPISPGR